MVLFFIFNAEASHRSNLLHFKLDRVLANNSPTIVDICNNNNYNGRFKATRDNKNNTIVVEININKQKGNKDKIIFVELINHLFKKDLILDVLFLEGKEYEILKY